MSEKKRSPKAKVTAPSTSGPMDVPMLERIVKLMQANDLNIVDLRDGDKRVMLQRGGAVNFVPASTGTVSSIPSGAPAASSAASAPVDETAGLIEIKSPMVGTFYATPSPDAKPFVNVGTSVTEETDVCVIEAMKVFNNVKAECRGTISKILVNSGQAVEFGQVLFLVKP